MTRLRHELRRRRRPERNVPFADARQDAAFCKDLLANRDSRLTMRDGSSDDERHRRERRHADRKQQSADAGRALRATMPSIPAHRSELERHCATEGQSARVRDVRMSTGRQAHGRHEVRPGATARFDVRRTHIGYAAIADRSAETTTRHCDAPGSVDDQLGVRQNALADMPRQVLEHADVVHAAGGKRSLELSIIPDVFRKRSTTSMCVTAQSTAADSLLRSIS